jgi:O-acetyl-ADP-ribose deacetylase (regulator of RNase III)
VAFALILSVSDYRSGTEVEGAWLSGSIPGKIIMRELCIGGSRIELVRGDITGQDTDAIVNAANTSLLGGGGVDGAIHRAGGPAILTECRELGGCATGEAKITSGGKLRAKYVVHTVGPIYRDGKHGEPDLLASAYRRSLEVAAENGVTTLAFPSISTGAYGFPIAQAARIAIMTLARMLRATPQIRVVRFVLFSASDLAIYEQALAETAAQLHQR